MDDALFGLGDAVLAVRIGCPVLISGPADEALDLAQMIASESGLHGGVQVCDLDRPDAAREVAIRPHPSRVLMLPEVHTLTGAQQAELMQALDDALARGIPPRIIASSSVSLFNCVRRGAFDADLFYRLNALTVEVAEVAQFES
jgi:hypothetical protein